MVLRLLKDAFWVGFLLWLVGYGLGLVFGEMIPEDQVGWALVPAGIVTTLYMLLFKIKKASFVHYLTLAIVWTGMAVVLDYILLVRAFRVSSSTLNLDAYLSYGLTFVLPLIAWKMKHVNEAGG